MSSFILIAVFGLTPIFLWVLFAWAVHQRGEAFDFVSSLHFLRTKPEVRQTFIRVQAHPNIVWDLSVQVLTTVLFGLVTMVSALILLA